MPGIKSTRRLILSAIAISLFGVGALALVAQEKIPPAAISPSPAPTSSPELSLLPLIPGTGIPPDPDESKSLYGYEGRYYNVSNLDGRVAVVQKSVYVWPVPTWKASGMLRNQTRDATHVTRLTARLLSANGTLIATATASLPVADLRPGEPGPFIIEAPVGRNDVKSVDWQIESAPALPQLRPLVIEEDYGPINIPNGPKYWLIGALRNAATTTLSNVRVVAAWLDDQGRVRYVASPAFRPFIDRPEVVSTIDLPIGGYKFFTYEPSEPWLVSLFEHTYDLAIWGMSE